MVLIGKVKEAVMVRLHLIIVLGAILLVGFLSGCSVNRSLTLTEHHTNRTKTFDYKGNLYLKNDTLWFESKKGTNQCVDLARYSYKINGKDKPVDVNLLMKRNN